MLRIPTIKTLVDGFELSAQKHPGNIAGPEGGQGAHLLEDGYIEVLVTNTGKNISWAEKEEFSVLIARMRNTNRIPDVESDISTIILMADDSPIEIRIEESVFNQIYGVWLVIECESAVANNSDSTLRHMMSVAEHSSSDNLILH